MNPLTRTLVCTMLVATLAAAQSTIHVDANAQGPGNGSPSDPFLTIQEGVDATSQDGDRVEIAPGHYAENVVVPPRRMDIIGTQGADVTVVDGNNQAVNGDMPVFTFSHPQNYGCNVRGLTIQGGRGSMISEAPEVWVGGGILCIDVTIGVRSCVFDSNEVIPYHGLVEQVEGWGGGIGWVGKGPEVISCTFVRNFARNGGGAVGGAFATSPTDRGEFYSCLLVENHTFGVGGGVGLRDANIRMVNCTLSKNDALLGGGIHVSGANTSQEFQNMIVRANVPDEIFISGGATPGFFDSNVQGGVPGGNSVGTVDVDPMWVDPAKNDFHLGFGSPMIDAANNVGGIPITDFEGDARIVGNDIDTGADEFAGMGVPAEALSGNIGLKAGGPHEILSINGSTGGYSRRVDVKAGGALTFAVDQPPTNPLPAPFLLFAMLGTPQPGAITTLPFGIGQMVVEPAFMNPTAPTSVVIANSFLHGVMPGLLPSHAAPWAATVTVPPTSGYVTFQGIALEDASRPRVTNAVIVEIH